MERLRNGATNRKLVAQALSLEQKVMEEQDAHSLTAAIMERLRNGNADRS